MTTAAILAAGASRRLGYDKTTCDLGDKPVWRWSYDTYSSHPGIDRVLVVASASNLASIRSKSPQVIQGGETRQESARRALEECGPEGVLLLHDAARPFVTPRAISNVLEAIARCGAAAVGVPVTDTIKEIEGTTIRTLDRSRLVAMQTPQGARVDLLRKAHESAAADATDDLALIEAIGVQPEIVPGDPGNFKITTEEDLARARAVVADPSGEVRTGFGYDVHGFSRDPARTLMLGGVPFPDHPALDGHSDADVLLHAATDALLGAAGMADIGHHFPNTDPRWRNEPSLTFLRAAASMLSESGWSVVNVDLTLVAETPKIGPQREAIVSAISGALTIEPGRVSVKATTNERLGFIGRGEGIAALAVATIRRP